MYTFSQVLLRYGGYTKIAEMLFDIPSLPVKDIQFPFEPPSQQDKQIGAGEQCIDDRVIAPNK